MGEASLIKKRKLWNTMDKNHLDYITFRGNGMPRAFKYLWALPIAVLRAGVMVGVFLIGGHFLMNTGGIIDLVLNSLALTFIINLDDLMLSTFARERTREIMNRLQPYEVPIKGKAKAGFESIHD